jgi:hypothetical protein
MCNWSLEGIRVHPTYTLFPVALFLLFVIVELYSETGRTYKGEWRSGMAHGRGVETYPDGRIRHDGQWIENEPVDNEPRARQCYELSLPNPNRKTTLKELIPLLWIYPSGRSNHSYSDVSLMSDLDDETPPKVPLMGDVTLVTLGMSEELQCRPPPRRVVSPDTALDRSNSNDENTNHRDDDVANDDNSVGNTVAASTCEDDRQMVVSHKIVDQHGARGEYSGVVLRSTGKPHGRGTMVYDDHGRTYDGDWCRGQYHGYGRATYANGNFYDGEFQLINVMDVASIAGPTDGSIKENSAKISATGRAPCNGRMVTYTLVNSRMDERRAWPLRVFRW